MANTIRPPDDIRIASLEKQKRESRYNLMAPGPGTPWEDRGSTGSFMAFIRTAITGLISPRKLWDSIRRPETPGDATGFAIACGIMWSLSALVHALLFRMPEDTADYVELGLLIVLIPFIVLILLKVAAAIYYKMIAHDMPNKAPSVLTYNVFAYSLSPSALAIIPIAGPPLAAAWIVLLLIVSGFKRQYLKAGSAIISAVVAAAACAAMLFGFYYAIIYLFRMLAWLWFG